MPLVVVEVTALYVRHPLVETDLKKMSPYLFKNINKKHISFTFMESKK